MRVHRILAPVVCAVAVCLAPTAAMAVSASSSDFGAGPGLTAGSGSELTVSIPKHAVLRQQFQIRVRLTRPVSVAAFETAVLANTKALSIVAGIPGNGKGRMIDPAFSLSAARVGFYAGTPSGTRSDLIDILVSPKKSGVIRIHLALPLAVDASGKVVGLRYRQTVYTVRVGTSKRVWLPAVTAHPVALHPTTHLKLDVTHDGHVTRADLYQAVAAWDSTKANAHSGGITGRTGDVDGDGYTTVRDLQLLIDRTPAQPTLSGRGSTLSTLRSAFAATQTWVVNTTSDLPDANPGDHICATVLGTCSLRAAIDEANRRRGDDLITFAIPGGAPQTIQLTSMLTQINSTAGAVMIDGYSEPGAHPNTDSLVSNALPGIVINGGWAGSTSKSASLMVTSPNNVIQGLAFNIAGRGIYLYGPSSQNNYILGDFFGMNATGAFSYNTGYAAIDIDGASHNVVGTPNLADRNVIAGFFYGIDHVSPGTTYNVEQNNLIGLSPDGNNVDGASCDDVDHNAGPQHNQLGGLGDHERNVIVGGGCDGVEYSHGWNQALAPRADESAQWQVNDNTIQGNYIGFAPDGHYEYRFIEAQGRYDEQDGSGVNVIDVSNGNLVEGNWIATHVNGVQVFGFDTQNNIIRGNHIGISPLGTPAYIGYSGVSIRWHASNTQVIGNDIHNTGQRPDEGPPPPNNPNAPGCQQNLQNIPDGCGAGIRVNESDDVENLISQNTFQNIGNGIGIDLAPIGVINPNDPGDADTGANTMLNFPVITGATTAAISGTACINCRVEVSATTSPVGVNGYATSYIGAATANSTGNWTLPVGNLNVGDVVTSLAIDADGNTSEQSVDVQVGPAPQAGDAVAADSFSRVLAGGWGTAELGGPWYAIGTAGDFAVNGAAATMNLPAGGTREARLGALAQADVSVAASFAFDRIPVGGNAFAYLTARTQGNVAGSASYRGQIRLGANGLVYTQIRKFVGNVETAISPEVVVPGLTYTAGLPLRARLSAIGTSPTTLSLRVWVAGQTEPASWNVSTTDSEAALQTYGGVGLRGYAGGPVSNGPMSLAWDDLDVRLATP